MQCWLQLYADYALLKHEHIAPCCVGLPLTKARQPGVNTHVSGGVPHGCTDVARRWLSWMSHCGCWVDAGQGYIEVQLLGRC